MSNNSAIPEPDAASNPDGRKVEPGPAPRENVGASSAACLATVGLLSSRLSGELRQPLGVIRNAIYFLNIHLGTTTDDKVRRHLGIMLREIESVTTIVSNLAGLTSNRPPKRESSDVEVIVAAALEHTGHPANIKVETVIPPHSRLFCDPTQMCLAITNLLDNSIRAMPEGGSIRIVCRSTPRETTIEVVDTGRGMTAETQVRVFEPLFTTSPQQTGLGMTVVRTLIGANGGKVELESAPDKGTTVRLRFRKH